MCSEERSVSKSWKVALVALPCLVAPLGCVPEAVRYNSEVTVVTRELEAAGKQFGEKLRENLGNRAKAKELHEDTVKYATGIIKRGKALTPPNTTEGKALHKAFLSYLETQEQIIRVEFASIALYAGQNKLPEAMPTILRAQQQEQAKSQQLQAAQQAFAKANNIHLY
jgi:hypothetical protein